MSDPLFFFFFFLFVVVVAILFMLDSTPTESRIK